MNEFLKENCQFTEYQCINKLLGIYATYNYDKKKKIYYDVHFYDSKGYEFEAYVMEDDIEDYQQDIVDDLNALRSFITFDQLVNKYFRTCGKTIKLEGFTEHTDDTPILDFYGHKLQMFY